MVGNKSLKMFLLSFIRIRDKRFRFNSEKRLQMRESEG